MSNSELRAITVDDLKVGREVSVVMNGDELIGMQQHIARLSAVNHAPKALIKKYFRRLGKHGVDDVKLREIEVDCINAAPYEKRKAFIDAADACKAEIEKLLKAGVKPLTFIEVPGHGVLAVEDPRRRGK